MASTFLDLPSALAARKLILIIDLDSILIYRTRFSHHDVPSDHHTLLHVLSREINRNTGQEEVEVAVLRPWLRSFIHGLAQRFQLALIAPNCSLSERVNLRQAVRIIDRDSKYFDSRILWQRSDLRQAVPDLGVVCILGEQKTAGHNWWCHRLLIPSQAFYHDFDQSQNPEVTSEYLPKLRRFLEDVHTRFFSVCDTSGTPPDLRKIVLNASNEGENTGTINRVLFESDTSDYDRTEDVPLSQEVSPCPSCSSFLPTEETSSELSSGEYQLLNIKADEYNSILREQRLLAIELRRLDGAACSSNDHMKLIIRWNYLLRRKDRIVRDLIGHKDLVTIPLLEESAEETLSVTVHENSYDDVVTDFMLSNEKSLVPIEAFDDFWSEMSIHIFKLLKQRKAPKKCIIL